VISLQKKQEAWRMNPDRNKGGMTLSSLMHVGLASAAVPIVLITLISVVVASQSMADPSRFEMVVLICAILILIAILAINYFVQRQIKDRILTLVDVSRAYAGGEHSVRVPVNGDDEFAMLANSMNSLMENAGNGNVVLAGGDAATLQAQIEKLLQEVSAVGDGDLRVQAEVTPDTLGVLADSFNYMIEELAKVVGRVQSTAVQINNATRRILDGSADLAQASETQVAQISQTTASVEALANFIQDVARNARMSAEAAQEALRNAESGQQSVRQTIDGMMVIRENVQETAKKIKRLGERSNEIGEILRIIEDIADQTNLLALNAAIQSAMAGEHGRGFAVVADEIRLLAERSTESTKRIATLIKSIQGDTYEAVVAMEDSTQEVVKGSQLADEAGRALNSIYNAVARQTQMIEGIARAANEQTPVANSVAVAMGQISEITRRTDIGTQEAAASVSYLADLAEQLRASVSTFRLPDHASETVGALPGATSVSEFSGNGFPAMDSQWSQDFVGSFPPLPEPGSSSGSLIATTARSGQYMPQEMNTGFNGQFQFNSQPGFDARFDGQQFFDGSSGFDQGFGGQQGFEQNFGQQGFEPDFGQQGFDQNFGDQQNFGAFHGFDNQQSFAGQSAPGGQQQFGAFHGFDNQQNSGGQQSFPGQPASTSQPGFPGQPGGQPSFGGNGNSFPGSPTRFTSQPGYPVNPAQAQAQTPGMRTSGDLPPQGRPRWQGQPNAPQNQGQPQFSQDQTPFNNRQSGQ
jgi:methyl-accepting chemotaxis protein